MKIYDFRKMTLRKIGSEFGLYLNAPYLIQTFYTTVRKTMRLNIINL